MLKNMWPQVLQYLMKRVGAKNQVEFAAKCKISRQGPSRYKTGRNRVEKNFSKIAKGTGLTENELGYVYAWHQLDYYRPYQFDLGIGSEVREPEALYDSPRAIDRAQALLRHDMRDVPAVLAPSTQLMRDELLEAVEQHNATVAESESRLSRRVDLFERHLSALKDLRKKVERERP